MPKAPRIGRKQVGDYLNEHAMDAAKCLVSIANGEITGGEAQTRQAASNNILNRVVPVLKAIELSAENISINHSIEFK